MKSTFYMLIIISAFFSSCCNDDDTTVDDNPIIGEWVLERTTDNDYYINNGGPQLDCINTPTTLNVNMDKATIGSLVVDVAPNKRCVGGDSSRITEDEVVFAEDDDSVALGTFPPPKNKFKYKLEEGKLILTDGANNDFIFIKGN